MIIKGNDGRSRHRFFLIYLSLWLCSFCSAVPPADRVFLVDDAGQLFEVYYKLDGFRARKLELSDINQIPELVEDFPSAYGTARLQPNCVERMMEHSTSFETVAFAQHEFASEFAALRGLSLNRAILDRKGVVYVLGRDSGLKLRLAMAANNPLSSIIGANQLQSDQFRFNDLHGVVAHPAEAGIVLVDKQHAITAFFTDYHTGEPTHSVYPNVVAPKFPVRAMVTSRFGNPSASPRLVILLREYSGLMELSLSPVKLRRYGLHRDIVWGHRTILVWSREPGSPRNRIRMALQPYETN